MYVSLGLALLLLVVMAWLILRPFLGMAAAGVTAAPPVVAPPRNLGTPRPAATTTAVAATATAAPAGSPSVDELRASVEAAVAARKAAMMGHSCSGCDAPVDPGDVFCRACGTRVKEG